MEKSERIALIREIVGAQKVRTQKDLAELLAEKMGPSEKRVTQAMLSRDMRDANIVKKRENGALFYAINVVEKTAEEALSVFFAQYVTKVERADFMLVIHTGLGEASLLADALDNSGRADILGTLAGADTLFVCCVDRAAAAALLAEVEDGIVNS